MALVELDAVDKSYGDHQVLADCALQVAAGEVVAVQGVSGTGKSTLLNILGLLDTADAGSYRFDGQAIEHHGPARRSRLRAASMGFVFQGFHLLPEFDLHENILMPARCAGRLDADCRHRALELLERVDLADRASDSPHELSGGERQRVALCRALLLRPRLILADEPTGNLDPTTAGVVLDLLLELAAASDSAVVLVTHDAAVAARAHRRLELQGGRLQ